MRRYSIQAYREPPDKHAGGEWETTDTSSSPLMGLLQRSSQQTSRSGVAHRIVNSGGGVVATFKRGDDRQVVMTVKSALMNRLLALQGSTIRRGEARELALSEEVDNVNNKLSGYRASEQKIADSRREAIRRYNAYPKPNILDRAFNNTPRILRCLSCRLYFAIPGTRRVLRCPHCQSTKVRRVK